MVGCGVYGAGTVPATHYDGKKRACTNRVTSFCPVAYTDDCFITKFDEPTSNNTTNLEGGMAPGDSGGSLLMRHNGELYIIGINCYSTPDRTYGAYNVFVPLFPYVDWIQSFLSV